MSDEYGRSKSMDKRLAAQGKPAAPQSDQPCELHRKLNCQWMTCQAAPASQPSAPAQKPHLDGITPEFQPSPASVDAREWAERVDALYREYGQYVNVSRLATLLESFRAETLARMLELLNSHRLLSGKPGDECSCGKWNANYTNRDRDVWQAWLQHIRALSPDHNWLARQIAEAQIAELDALETVTDEAGVLAEWGSVAQIRYKNRRRAALESASAKLGDKGEAR